MKNKNHHFRTEYAEERTMPKSPYRNSHHLKLKQEIKILKSENTQMRKRLAKMEDAMHQVYLGKKKYKVKYKELQQKLSILQTIYQFSGNNIDRVNPCPDAQQSGTSLIYRPKTLKTQTNNQDSDIYTTVTTKYQNKHKLNSHSRSTRNLHQKQTTADHTLRTMPDSFNSRFDTAEYQGIKGNPLQNSPKIQKKHAGKIFRPLKNPQLFKANSSGSEFEHEYRCVDPNSRKRKAPHNVTDQRQSQSMTDSKNHKLKTREIQNGHQSSSDNENKNSSPKVPTNKDNHPRVSKESQELQQGLQEIISGFLSELQKYSQQLSEQKQFVESRQSGLVESQSATLQLKLDEILQKMTTVEEFQLSLSDKNEEKSREKQNIVMALKELKLELQEQRQSTMTERINFLKAQEQYMLNHQKVMVSRQINNESPRSRKSNRQNPQSTDLLRAIEDIGKDLSSWKIDLLSNDSDDE